MGDVVWTDEAAAAVSREILLGDGVARYLADYVVEPRTDAVLAALTPHVEAMVREARAEALDQAADALVWKQPEKSPCVDFESCCGSEAFCDAMTPSVSVVGEDWLRSRAEEVRRGE